MKNKLILAFKIITSALVAILVARLINLEFAVSTGVIAILTIQPTKRETIKTAIGRFVSFMLALSVATVFFFLLGVNWSAFFAFLIVYVLLCCILNLSSTIAPCTVLVAHFLTVGDLSVASLLNEVLIYVVGAGVGILANIHLKKDKIYMKELNNATDEQIKKILMRMSERVINGDISDYNGQCFDELDERIFEARELAVRNYKNQFDKSDVYDMEYIDMRERQRQLLYEMYKCVRKLSDSPVTARKISDYLRNMAEVFEENNDCVKLLEEFYEMDAYMKAQTLPATRDEFENRARLYTLMDDIENFIKIKKLFYEKHH